MIRRNFSSVRPLRDHIWSDFTKRSSSLGVSNKLIKNSLLNGVCLKSGPPTIRTRENREKYTSPELIDSTFKLCYEFLETHSKKIYDNLENEQNLRKRNRLLVEAEINNPEVQYNFQYNDKLENNVAKIDYNQPVYRHLGKKHWESYKQMLLMQRLETLCVIPDTLPTLNPKANVEICFPFSTGCKKWIQPGEVLSSGVTSMLPAIKIQEFDHLIDFEKQFYSILIVNPDEPDLLTNSYKTVLNYGLINLKIDYNDNLVDPRKFNELENLIADYLPPVPEKNTGKQRFAVWVFRQTESIDKDTLKFDRNNFDIRDFVSNQKLTPIGAHIWRSEWDSNVQNVRRKYSLPPGRVFYKVRRV